MVNLAEYFHRNNYEVILVTQYKQDVEYNINPKISRIYSEPEENLLNNSRLHNFRIRFKTLRNIWKTYKPDIILSFLGKNNLMAVATSMLLPVKTVVSVRGEPTMEYQGKLMSFLAKLLFRFADGVVLQTKQSMKFFPKAVRKKSVIMSNPLNPEFLDRKYTGTRDDLIVTVGRLDDNKNQAMLIHAFARIATEFPNMKLVIYGDGECMSELEDLVRAKNLADRITLPGSITDVPEHICRARIFALTSNTEGMPNTIMEAMALGLAVVSTDCPCGGPAQLIEDGENGLLVPVGDAYALADAFRRILNDSSLEEKLRENALRITVNLAPDKVNKEWRDYLDNL
jgi:glycosyltransferase involved in cell wall biosynthesis